MTPRENIIRNLERKGPERIGMSFDNGRMNDFCGAGIGASSSWKQHRWNENGFEYYDDEWGNVWFRIENMSAGGEIFKPAIEDWSQLASFKLPDFANPMRYAKAKELFAKETERYRVMFIGGFIFASARYLRKMENYFQDLVLERGYIDELHGRMAELIEGIIMQSAHAGADGIFFCEDWGTQKGTLISPDMWRDIYKPLYKRLFGTAHRHGLHVLMHSCGYNWGILDDLAECGVNAFQFDQPHAYGLEKLAAKFRELNVCLYSPVDIQAVMPTGDRARIEDEAKKMIELFDGGLIAKNYPDLKGIGVAKEWDEWAYDVFERATHESKVLTA
ncbi:MAG: uroporphyrinogen decarboxylase family protein [Spirochaetota bacterium]